MDKEQIVKLARKAGFFPDYNWNKTDWHSAGHSDLFEAFAKLVAAHEREACAKVCDEVGDFFLADDYAAAIRARSNNA